MSPFSHPVASAHVTCLKCCCADIHDVLKSATQVQLHICSKISGGPHDFTDETSKNDWPRLEKWTVSTAAM